MSTEMDIATGLPKLPEGYWWRVERSRSSSNIYISDYLMVRLMHTTPKERWWTNKPHPTKTQATQVDYTCTKWATYAEAESPEAEILRLASYVLREWERNRRVASQTDQRMSLMGDYPPKKLS